MPELPAVGTRVSLRYRSPAGADRPFTDVVGWVRMVDPELSIETKTGALVRVIPAAVVAVRQLSDFPVRNSEIRALEHAAALAWPGTEQHFEQGWLLRAADGHTNRANSAVPVEPYAGVGALPAIADWYARRDLTPSLALADRLLRLPGDTPAGWAETRVMVRDLDHRPDVDVELAAEPDDRWMQIYQREIPVEVLTAVVDGTVAFGRIDDAAVGRVAVTSAPDGVAWAGLAAVRVADDARRRGYARRLCEALLAWGFDQGATRAYAQVVSDNTEATALYESMGFRTHHRARYVDARSL